MLMERSTSTGKGKSSASYRRLSAYSWRVALKHPATVLGLVLLGLFAYLIFAPVFFLLLSSVQVGFGDELATGLEAGSWTSHYFKRVFAVTVSPFFFYRPLFNTLDVAVLLLFWGYVFGVYTGR